MTNVLKEAIAEVARLPEAAQDKIGEELLLHVDKLRRLRAKLDKGIQSLDRGEGRELDIEDVTKRARAQHGRA
jgi:Arc/MetJ-type ribon-helix-helix transcriptional regulator